jgi:hypothetical protein
MSTRKLYAAELEAAVIGAGLIDPPTFAAVDVGPGDFHDTQLGEILRAGRDLVATGGHVDAILIADELDRRGTPVSFAKLTSLANNCPNYLAAPEYAGKVRDLARRRAALELLQKSVRTVYSSNGTWGDELAEHVGRLTAVAQSSPPAKARPARKTSWTLAELRAATFPPPRWAVPGLVPIGFSILAGRPKVGKSWLALQIAHAVATGGMVLDQRIEAGKVLYLALEDGAARILDRCDKQRVPTVPSIVFHTEWRNFDAGGLEDLQAAIERDGYTLAIVDTLGRALGRADQSDWTDMTYLVGDLQNFAIGRDVSILAVDHQRKPAGFAENPVDDIIGSTAKSAITDAALGLYRQQGKRDVILRATGRDFDEQELCLSWDAALYCWQLEGTAEEVALRGRKSDVLTALRSQHPEPLTSTELARLAELKRPNVVAVLNDLVNDGLVERLPKVGREVPHRLTQRGLT